MYHIVSLWLHYFLQSHWHHSVIKNRINLNLDIHSAPRFVFRYLLLCLTRWTHPCKISFSEYVTKKLSWQQSRRLFRKKGDSLDDVLDCRPFQENNITKALHSERRCILRGVALLLFSVNSWTLEDGGCKITFYLTKFEINHLNSWT